MKYTSSGYIFQLAKFTGVNTLGSPQDWPRHHLAEQPPRPKFGQGGQTSHEHAKCHATTTQVHGLEIPGKGGKGYCTKYIWRTSRIAPKNKFLLSFYEDVLLRYSLKGKNWSTTLKTHISDGDFWIKNSELSHQLLEEQKTNNDYDTFLFTITDLRAFWNLTLSNLPSYQQLYIGWPSMSHKAQASIVKVLLTARVGKLLHYTP